MADLTTLLNKFLTNYYIGVVPVTGVAFGNLPASPMAGMVAYVTDCNTNVWGAQAAAGGANKVLVWYNGTNWTVAGK